MLCCSFYFYLMMLFQFCLAPDFFSSPGPRFHESQQKTNCIVFIETTNIPVGQQQQSLPFSVSVALDLPFVFPFCDAKVNQGKADSSSLAGQTRKHLLLSTVGILIKMKSFLSSRIGTYILIYHKVTSIHIMCVYNQKINFF